MLLHEDYPHPVPTRAWLRWKENYFWVFMDPERDICCLAHCTAEPTHDRAFASFVVLHKGRTFGGGVETAMPSPFELSRDLTYGNLRIQFLEPQKTFRVTFEDETIAATLDFTARMHLFDFLACTDVNPDQYSVSENTALARNEFRHQGQCLTGKGRIAFKSGDFADTAIDVDGLGYRDHSWGMRNDQITQDHNWSFFNFPSMGFHLFTVRNIVRPENRTWEGYHAVPAGNQVVKALAIEADGEGAEGMPETVTFRVTTVDGQRFTLIADVGAAFARLPLQSQKPGSKVYLNVENMCRARCVETGEEGLANVEIGRLVDA